MDENEDMPDLNSESGYDGNSGDDSESADDEDAYDYYNLATKGYASDNRFESLQSSDSYSSTGIRMEADKGALKKLPISHSRAPALASTVPPRH